MTRQDWIIVGAGWLALAAIIVGLMLDQRRIERRLRRHRGDLSNHARRLVQIEAAQRGLATSTRAPMPTVGGYAGPSAAQVGPGRSSHRGAAPGDDRADTGDRFESREPSPPPWASLAGGNVRRLFTAPDPDDTVRLGRPPALGDIEHVLTKADNRPHTGVELARALGRKPWDLLPELDRLVNSGRVELITGHTAGHVAYRLVETVRMTHTVLPGASR